MGGFLWGGGGLSHPFSGGGSGSVGWGGGSGCVSFRLRICCAFPGCWGGGSGCVTSRLRFWCAFRAAGSWCSELWLQWDALMRVLRGRASVQVGFLV
jgi:hypothetical protein